MSKVYSFRLDVNNPREAQAREVIDTWVAQGYSLRHQLVDALISFHNNELQGNGYDGLLMELEQLIERSKGDRKITEHLEGTLANTFIQSLSESVKAGLHVE